MSHDPRASVAGQVAYEVCVSVPVGSEVAFEEFMVTDHIAQIYAT